MATQLYILTASTLSFSASTSCPAYNDTFETFTFTVYDDSWTITNAPLEIVIELTGTTNPGSDFSATTTILTGTTSNDYVLGKQVAVNGAPGCPCPCYTDSEVTSIQILTSDPEYTITLVGEQPPTPTQTPTQTRTPTPSAP